MKASHSDDHLMLTGAAITAPTMATFTLQVDAAPPLILVPSTQDFGQLQYMYLHSLTVGHPNSVLPRVLFRYHILRVSHVLVSPFDSLAMPQQDAKQKATQSEEVDDRGSEPIANTDRNVQPSHSATPAGAEAESTMKTGQYRARTGTCSLHHRWLQLEWPPQQWSRRRNRVQ